MKMLRGEKMSILRTFPNIEEDQNLELESLWKMLKVLNSLSPDHLPLRCARDRVYR
jgi:hypothetical protein